MKHLRAERSSRGRDFFASQVTGHGIPATSSLRGSANSASLRYAFPFFPSQLSNPSNFKHPNAAFPLLTTDRSLPTDLPRTSTLPPPNYGIIPPHRGSTRNPFRKRGGFSD